MGRLFWKFFLAFWLALLLAGIGVGSAVWLRNHAEQAANATERIVDVRHAAALVAVADSAMRYGGGAELRRFLEELRDGHLPPVYALDDQNNELLQRRLAPDVLSKVRMLHRQGEYPKAIRSTIAQDGQGYLLFMLLPEHGFTHPEPGEAVGGEFAPPPFPPEGHEDFHPPPPASGLFAGPPPAHHGPPGPLASNDRPSPLIPILSGIVASLVFSAALAWYFAKPIRSLRRAFAALAQGDLETRVSDQMGKRSDELSGLGRDFDHMAGQIHSLVHAQQRLLHDVSHELRSPLARIQAAIGLAQQQPDKFSGSLQRIERESQRISDLIGELLVLSRLEAGVERNQVDECELGGLLDEIMGDVRFEADQRQVSIRYQGIAETLVAANGELLHRAIENVVRNAVQHCKAGGEVTVTAEFEPRAQRLNLCIEDQGPGVAENDLSAIFEPFFRSGQRKKPDSAGLGLAIAYHAVTAHGGRIQAGNRPQGGLRMDIEIPFAKTAL